MVSELLLRVESGVPDVMQDDAVRRKATESARCCAC